MNPRSIFKFTIEDESRLETVVSYSAPRKTWIALGSGVAIVFMILGTSIAFLTPLRSLLPGYMNRSERAANQIMQIRLDSLHEISMHNSAFIENIINVMNPSESKRDTAMSKSTVPLEMDSLLATSIEESRFVSSMKEREKYNITVMSQLAAESLMFTFPVEDGIFSKESEGIPRAEIIMAKKAPVRAISDGTVIGVVQSLRDGGVSITIQHGKGFLSRISRLGNTFVEPGDHITGGQIIALQNRGNGRMAEKIWIELWRNGTQLIPSEYLHDKANAITSTPVIDVNVGRGKF